MPVTSCPTPCPPIVKGIVVFSAPEFVALWPEFTGLLNPQMENAFNIAQILLNNSCGSIVQDANLRMSLLYMLTAHVCFLNSGTNDGAGNVTPAPGIVGRINSASQGSVSVSAAYATTIGQSMAFFIQTKYGAQYWQATLPYRSAFYVPPPAFGPNGPGFPWPGAGFGIE